ncbi:ABC transporter substrate-binding protein [Natronomonas gomsonensis]|uniref:ABC transporter substrate-binding protein n=1 Tax=Natronomonas gomsonensis TaxID=1046043 RepID=UPI0020CA6437|nr:ABC transporter substrate-binding protein [Natronomonas gomsonensis]MCY4729937.1 ABC transporter substrate-binding protein [Natronomonas gomsonensis]
MTKDNSPMERRTFIQSAGTIGAIGTFGLAGCAQQTGNGNNTPTSTGNGGGGSSEDTLKIGLPSTISGAYASLGEFNNEGFRLKAEQLNRNGGILGKEVELFVEDNELSGDTAVQNTRKLVNEDDVDLIMGVPSSGVSLAVAPVAEELGVPFISTVNGTGRLTGDLCNRYVFRVNNNAPQGARAMTRYLMEDRGFETLSFVGSDYAWPQSVLEYVRSELETLGYNPDDVIQSSEFAPLDTQDYASYITSMTNSGADAGMAIFAGTPAIRFLTQARNFGLMDEMHISGTTLAQVDHMRPVGEDMRGISSVARWTFTLDTPGNNEWVSNYISENGRAPQNFTASAWQGLTAVANVIEEAGSVDPDDFISTFEGYTWEDPFEGEFTMRAEDHQASNPEYMVEVVSESEWDGNYVGDVETTVFPNIVREFQPDTVMRSTDETGCSL